MQRPFKPHPIRLLRHPWAKSLLLALPTLAVLFSGGVGTPVLTAAGVALGLLLRHRGLRLVTSPGCMARCSTFPLSAQTTLRRSACTLAALHRIAGLPWADLQVWFPGGELCRQDFPLSRSDGRALWAQLVPPSAPLPSASWRVWGTDFFRWGAGAALFGGLLSPTAPWAAAGLGAAAILRRMAGAFRTRIALGDGAAVVHRGFPMYHRFAVFSACMGLEFRQYGIFSATGALYAFAGGVRPLLLAPVCTPAQAVTVAHHLFPTAEEPCFAPVSSARLRMLRLPLLGLSGAVAGNLLPGGWWTAAAVLLLWRIGLVLRRFSGVQLRVGADTVTLFRIAGLSFRTTVLPRAQISAASLRQHPFQRRRGTCTLRLHTVGGALTMPELPLRDGLRLLRLLT